MQDYREAYDMFACNNGILFNHESSTRGETFVTRKITKKVFQEQILDLEECVYMGNLDAGEDWGHAQELRFACR